MLKLILSLLFLLTLPYYFCYMYDFKKGQPFSGDQFYNPYENMDTTWLKVNMHAHSKSFGGLANGKNTSAEMHQRYQGLGYDMDLLTNYNQLEYRVQSDRLNYPSYEHGFNLGMVHRLVYNADNVRPLDYPFVQLRSHKQHSINRVKENENLVAIAHPSWRNGHSNRDLEYLMNYDLIEGISERANSIKQWDAALSFGHAVWIVGNDDAHDVADRHTGVVWTMINGREDVTTSLRKGNHYATKGWLGQQMHQLRSLTVTDNTFRLKLTEPADSIILRSDNGMIVQTITNSDSIEYIIQSENTYVRAEIFESETWNDYTKTYLNPVIRSSDGGFQAHAGYSTKIHWWKSSGYWLLLLLIDIFILRLIIRK